jgi:5-formyltetrahydrofolate cyclo-ligase
MTSTASIDRKDALRLQAWSDLRRHNVALPDSRFGFDFSSFIPDFRGSSSAVDKLVACPAYRSARVLFITPDNSLQELRYRALKDGKRLLVATYGLRRGFMFLDPTRIGAENLQLASLLDGMERFDTGRSVSVSQLYDEVKQIDICITGAGAVSVDGVRIGKGHGFFDIEWAILYDRKLVDQNTPVATIVHNCQVVYEDLYIPDMAVDMLWDVRCDLVFTPDADFRVATIPKPKGGVLWDKLDPAQLELIPALQELKGIQMMEAIMNRANDFHEPPKPKQPEPSAEELLGIQMMERIMNGLKP